MTEDEKVQKLFFPAMYNFGEQNIDAVLNVLKPGYPRQDGRRYGMEP